MIFLLSCEIFKECAGQQYQDNFGQTYQNPGYQQFRPSPYSPRFEGIGPRDYEDECMLPSSNIPMDSSKLCDIGRGLTCFRNGRCGCIVPGSIYRQGRCRAKVDRPFVGTDDTTIECVRNAECKTATRICKCKRNYWSNDEGTACWNSGRNSLKIQSWYLFTLPVVASMIIMYF